MNKDPKIFLKHILESIQWIEKDSQNLSEEEFFEFRNVPTQDAVIRRLEIIGEAIRSLPNDLKRKYPEIPWQDIMDMRNILIHKYFGVDLNLVWGVIKKDIPSLKEHIKKMLKQLS